MPKCVYCSEEIGTGISHRDLDICISILREKIDVMRYRKAFLENTLVLVRAIGPLDDDAWEKIINAPYA